MIKLPLIEDWHWEVTRRCNQRCSHCIIGDLITTEMSGDIAMKAIAKIASLGGKRIYITGGEPFIREDLYQLVSYAKGLGFHISIITNGILKNTIMPFVKDALIDHLGVSIDGDKVAHDLIRGQGSYAKTFSLLKTVLRTGLTVTVYITINSYSLNCLCGIFSELIELGIASFHLNEINREGRAKANCHLLIGNMSESEKIETVSSQLSSLVEFSDLSIDCSCTISSRVAYLSANGNVYPCAEIAIASPRSRIASLLDNNFDKKFQKYHSDIQIPRKCRYSVYSTGGIDICLNSSDFCPVMEGEQK